MGNSQSQPTECTKRLLEQPVIGSHKQSNRRSTADRLMQQIYLWIFTAQQFALALKKLATELETAPEQCKGLTTGQKIGLAFLMMPYGPLLGTLYYSAITYLTSCTSNPLKSKLEKNKIKSQNSQKIGEKVQQLNTELRSQSHTDDVDRYVLFELLKSLGKLEGLTDSGSTGAMEQLMNDFLKNPLKENIFQTAMANLQGLLQFFGIYLLVSTNQIVRHDSTVSLGLVGLSSSLPEAFGNCQKALDKHDEAKATEILRDISDRILMATGKLSELSYETQSGLAKAVQSQTGRSQRDQSERREGSGATGRVVASGVAGEAVAVASGGAGGDRGGGGGGGGGRRHEEEEGGNEEESSDSEGDGTPKRKKLRMALLNVRSITKKAVIDGCLIKNLILNNNIDFFLTTETWLKPGPEGNESLRSLVTSNLNFVHRPRGEGRGGGVAIVFSDQFECELVNLPNVCTFEYVAASVQHQTWDRPILIITVYRPPRQDYNEFCDFETELTFLLTDIPANYSSIILAGDFNIWIDQQRGTGCEFVEFLKENNLEQFVHEPTHRAGHTLDLVIGREMKVTNVTVNNDNISDHFTVYFEARPKKKKKDIHDEL